MPKSEQFIVIDVGAVALHVAEFSVDAEDRLVIHAFDSLEYIEPLGEDNRLQAIGGTLHRILASGKFRSKNACLCISGQYAFMRFNKIPRVSDDEEDIRNMVHNQAKQDMPFPIEEVVWDYQLIQGPDEEEIEVMFALIKNEVINDIIKAIRGEGLKVKLVDFSPAALFNVGRANYVGEEECAMLLDIGGKCTILVFLEGNRFFARSIPIAGATISQQIAREFNISVEEAEVLKRRYGFVALGGAYEEPESEVAATISKIIRNVMARLHGEINRTINYYRSQKKGSKPVKLYLAGGSSTMPFTQHFFSEKLRMEVSYFNAFNVVRLASTVDKTQLEQTAHLYPEVVGTALRYIHHCPVEIDLATAEMRTEGSLRQRLPAIIAACLVFLLGLGMWWGLNVFQVQKLRAFIADQKEEIKEKHFQLSEIENYTRIQSQAEDHFKFLNEFLQKRSQWSHLLNSIQTAKPLDIWISKLEVMTSPEEKAVTPAPELEEGLPNIPWIRGVGTRGGDDKASKEKKSAPGTIEWLRIEGYEVKIPEENIVNGKPQGPIRRIFKEEQVLAFNEIVKKYIAEQPELKKYANMVVGSKNYVTPDIILVNIFESALRTLQDFNPQGTMIVGMKQNPYTNASNVQQFEIQIQLRNPINVQR